MAIDNTLPVYVLQHPDETAHARGTAIIAQLCLQHYQCWVAEDFSSHRELHDLLQRHGDSSLLIYPAAHAEVLDAGEGRQEFLLSNQPERLIFIDASWRKAKKIWHSTPALQRLACARLQPEQASRYRIRKVPETGYLSTIESIARSLMWLENDQPKYQPLLHIFNRMIERQIDKMGQQTYSQNYEKRDADKSSKH